MTLDALHVELVEVVLRSGALRWRNDHVKLEVEDSWRGRSGAQWRRAGQWVAVPRALNDIVQVESRRHQGVPITRIGTVVPLRKHFDVGFCTHLEVREVLAIALSRATPRAVLRDALREGTRAIVVDEVFDANLVDLAVLELARDAGVDVSAIGDPWQAVYEFRGADPAAALAQLRAAGFDESPVLTSFRFRTPATLAVSTALRDGSPRVLPAGSTAECDVVLASAWESLWDCGPEVLPLSFGTIGNQTDAALLVLLGHVVERRLGRSAVYLSDAHAVLGLAGTVSPESLREACTEFVGTLLAIGATANAGDELPAWRDRLKQLGSPAQLRQLRGDGEAQARQRLQAIVARLKVAKSVPGMTVHQAKGGEWPRVGLRLSASEVAALAAGLNQTDENHRVLYVAATRAQDDVCIV